VEGDPHAENPQPEWQSAMIDVSGMSLAELAESPGPADAESGTALARSLRRLAATVAHPAEPIAGFNSAL
jgi:FXSXX-COOH protein